MSIKSNFSREVYYSRKELGITQERAAEYLNISTRWYQKIENGKVLPSTELTLKIIAFYGIDGYKLRTEDMAIIAFQVP